MSQSFMIGVHCLICFCVVANGEVPLMSVVNERCEYPNCENFCSRNLLPVRFCYEHAFHDDMHLAQQGPTAIMRSGSLPSEYLRRPAERQKCIVDDCKLYVPPGEGTLCSTH